MNGEGREVSKGCIRVSLLVMIDFILPSNKTCIRVTKRIGILNRSTDINIHTIMCMYIYIHKYIYIHLYLYTYGYTYVYVYIQYIYSSYLADICNVFTHGSRQSRHIAASHTDVLVGHAQLCNYIGISKCCCLLVLYYGCVAEILSRDQIIIAVVDTVVVVVCGSSNLYPVSRYYGGCPPFTPFQPSPYRPSGYRRDIWGARFSCGGASSRTSNRGDTPNRPIGRIIGIEKTLKTNKK